MRWLEELMSTKEKEEFENWRKELPKVKKKDIHNAHLWFKVTLTGIGTVVEVGRSDIPKKNKNITDYDSW